MLFKQSCNRYIVLGFVYTFQHPGRAWAGIGLGAFVDRGPASAGRPYMASRLNGLWFNWHLALIEGGGGAGSNAGRSGSAVRVLAAAAWCTAGGHYAGPSLVRGR